MTKRRGYACVGLHRPKFKSNVGSVLRASTCFGVSMVAISGDRPSRNMSRIATDTPHTCRHTPVIKVSDLRSVIPVGCVPVAIDIVDGAVELPEFTHPEQAFYVFGPEDGTLESEILRWCDYKVFIPTTICMNLAAAVNVVLYDRQAKRAE